jgi:hypothetical protein
MISAQPHKTVQEKLIERLMSTPNELASSFSPCVQSNR